MPEPKLTSLEKQSVSQRAEHCCEYCQSQQAYSPDPYAVEHIVPRSADGASSSANLALSCSGCNGHKYTRTRWLDPVSGEEMPLYHPRLQNWQEHFEWSSDFTLIIGLTAIGRATVEALQMNRPGLVGLRQVLFIAGKHPPLKRSGINMDFHDLGRKP